MGKEQMTITRYSSDWNPAMLVLFAYAILGLLLVFIPVPSHGVIPQFQQLPMMQAMQYRTFDRARMVFFWQWMLIAFPLVLAAFSAVAPIKLTPRKINTWYAIPVSIGAFVFFGLLGFPAFAYSVFFNDLTVNARIDRILVSTGRGLWDLFFAGSVLMIIMLSLAWYSYVLIPVSTYKLLKLRANTTQSGRGTHG
jgi:hypothetical protein